MVKRIWTCLVFLGVALIITNLAAAPSRYAPDGRDRWHIPLRPEQMTPYSNIPFSEKNFNKIQKKGLYEEDVLRLLGKPKDVVYTRTKGNRWLVKYFYPNGHVVNFRNGMAVGKEVYDEQFVLED